MGVFMKNKNKNKLTEDMGNMKTRLQKLSHGEVKIGECPFGFFGEWHIAIYNKGNGNN